MKMPGVGPNLEHAFDLHLDFHSRRASGPVLGGGQIGFVGVAGGRVSGPLLNGSVVANSGGDYAHIRPDGVVELNAHYLIEVEDGTLIYLHNRGYSDRTRIASRARAEDGAADEGYYFRVTPVFKTPVGPHDWLTRTIVLGAAERRIDPDHTVFRYYAVR